MTAQKIEFSVEGMHCGGCSGHLTTMLANLSGVSNVAVDHHSKKASLSIEGDRTSFAEITECVLDAGFTVVPNSLKNL